MRSQKILLLLAFFLPALTYGSCLVDAEICSRRSSLVGNIVRINERLQAACKKEIAIEIDWLSFKKLLIQNGDVSMSPCLRPLDQVAEYCEKDIEATQKLLKNIDMVKCSFAEKNKRTLKMVGKILEFESDLTNDDRSADGALGDSAYIKQEFEKLFSIVVTSKEEKRIAMRDKEKADRIAARDKADQERDEKRKRENEAQRRLAEQKSKVYLAETDRLSKWVQEETAVVQNSTDSPEVKGQKIQQISKKYQEEFQKALKAYQDGK